MTVPSAPCASRSSLWGALAAIVAAAALLAWSAPAFAAWDLQQLMDSLARNKSGRATFVETKHISMLDRRSNPRANWCSPRPTGWKSAP